MSERITDLERAEALLERMEQVRSLMPAKEGEFHAGLALIDALAAARREGAEEMRERAIAELHEWARDQCFIDIADPADWERVLRALPLTPEEPSHD